MVVENSMTPLDKARIAVEVRKQYEEADTKEERIRLARLLESVSKKATPQEVAA